MAHLKKIRALVIRLFTPYTENYTPKVIIFLLDSLITLFSIVITYLIVYSIKNEPFSITDHFYALLIIMGVQMLYFEVFKLYRGLIRFSSLRDATRQFFIITATVLTLLLINTFAKKLFSVGLFSSGGIIVFGVINFTILFLSRVTIKYIYDAISRKRPKHRNTLFWGLDRDDVSAAESLINSSIFNFKIIAFLSDHKTPMNNQVLGRPIYNIDELERFRRLPSHLIIREEVLKKFDNRQLELLESLLDLGLKIYKLPKVQNWIDTEEESIKQAIDKFKEINIEDLLYRSPIRLNIEQLSSIYDNKTILVTGAAGSIGSEIVRQLLNLRPKKIILFDQAETPLHLLSLELKEHAGKVQFKQIIGDVRNSSRLRKVFETFHPEIVFHAAAYKHVPMMEMNEIEAMTTNFYGTSNIANLSIEYNVKRFVFVSTDKAVNPTNIMGATKRSAELLIQNISQQPDKTTTFITTRFGNVLGSNGSVVPHFKKQIAKGGPITVTHPEITRYFMTISEACQLVLEAGGMGHGGEIFVFDMGEPVKILDLAKKMIRLSGFQPNKDIKIIFTGLRPGEKLYEELLADKETTLPTHHEKILIGKATCSYTDSELEILCNKLLNEIIDYNEDEALKTLKTLVPEYQPEIIFN